MGDEQRWVQFGVALPEPSPSLYGAVRELAVTVLRDGLAAEFGFLHKSPGLLLRFEPAEGRRAELRARVRAACADWRVTEPYYEPESTLFGGPSSLRYVHRLFTVDSLTWLDFHVAPAGPAWARSLPVLAELFAGLGVVGWEDLDSWQRVRVQCRRALPAAVTEAENFRQAADGVRAAWVRSRASADHPEVRAIAAEWRREYFDTGAASLGPREAAALVTIFHWNRGGLDSLRQGLLAEALGDRAAVLGAVS